MDYPQMNPYSDGQKKNKYCPNCGQVNAPTNNMCTRCGLNLVTGKMDNMQGLRPDYLERQRRKNSIIVAIVVVVVFIIFAINARLAYNNFYNSMNNVYEAPPTFTYDPPTHHSDYDYTPAPDPDPVYIPEPDYAPEPTYTPEPTYVPEPSNTPPPPTDNQNNNRGFNQF